MFKLSDAVSLETKKIPNMREDRISTCYKAESMNSLDYLIIKECLVNNLDDNDQV